MACREQIGVHSVVREHNQQSVKFPNLAADNTADTVLNRNRNDSVMKRRVMSTKSREVAMKNVKSCHTMSHCDAGDRANLPFPVSES